MQRIDPADLKPFLAIARHKSFRRAAAELGCTPSALSHGLRQLEGKLELRLINRTTRSVALTEAGERLMARVAPAFADIAAALNELDGMRGTPAGRLKFNASHTSAKQVLMPVIARFLKHYPDVQVEVDLDNALVDMVSEGFDAGLRLGETLAQDMIAVPLGPQQRSIVVGTPDLVARYETPATPHDLKGLPCIRMRFPSGRLYAWEFERKGQALVVEVDGPLIVNEAEAMLQAALAGVGFAHLFECQVTAHLAAGRLVTLLDDWCPPYNGFYLYYPSGRQMPAPLRAFIDFVRSEQRP